MITVILAQRFTRSLFQDLAIVTFMHSYFVYILASKPFGTLYIGITNDLIRRPWEHKQGKGSKFTKKYKVYRLVYYEMTEYVEDAIRREKQLKNWHRDWKINLIMEHNPEWKDLYPVVAGELDPETSSG